MILKLRLGINKISKFKLLFYTVIDIIIISYCLNDSTNRKGI